jgi:hypothetical protein
MPLLTAHALRVLFKVSGFFSQIWQIMRVKDTKNMLVNLSVEISFKDVVQSMHWGLRFQIYIGLVPGKGIIIWS